MSGLPCVCGHAYRCGAEREEAAEAAHRRADAAAQLRIAEDATDSAADGLADLAQQVAEPALGGQLCLLRVLGHRGVGAEREEAAEAAHRRADAAAQLRIAEDATDSAADGLADLAQQVAEPALGGQLCLLRVLGHHGVGAEREEAAAAAHRRADAAAQLRIAEDATDSAADGLAD